MDPSRRKAGLHHRLHWPSISMSDSRDWRLEMVLQLYGPVRSLLHNEDLLSLSTATNSHCSGLPPILHGCPNCNGVWAMPLLSFPVSMISMSNYQGIKRALGALPHSNSHLLHPEHSKSCNLNSDFKVHELNCYPTLHW